MTEALLSILPVPWGKTRQSDSAWIHYLLLCISTISTQCTASIVRDKLNENLLMDSVSLGKSVSSSRILGHD